MDLTILGSIELSDSAFLGIDIPEDDSLFTLDRRQPRQQQQQQQQQQTAQQQPAQNAQGMKASEPNAAEECIDINVLDSIELLDGNFLGVDGEDGSLFPLDGDDWVRVCFISCTPSPSPCTSSSFQLFMVRVV